MTMTATSPRRAPVVVGDVEPFLTYIRVGQAAERALRTSAARNRGGIPVFDCGIVESKTTSVPVHHFLDGVAFEPGTPLPPGRYKITWHAGHHNTAAHPPKRTGHFWVDVGRQPTDTPPAVAFVNGEPADVPDICQNQQVAVVSATQLRRDLKNYERKGWQAKSSLIELIDRFLIYSSTKALNFQKTVYSNEDVRQEAHACALKAIAQFTSRTRPPQNFLNQCQVNISRDIPRQTSNGLGIGTQPARDIAYINQQSDLDPATADPRDYAVRALTDPVRASRRKHRRPDEVAPTREEDLDPAKVESRAAAFEKALTLRNALNRPLSIDQPVEGSSGVTYVADTLADDHDAFEEAIAHMEDSRTIAAGWCLGSGIVDTTPIAVLISLVTAYRSQRRKVRPDDLDHLQSAAAIRHALDPLRKHGEQWSNQNDLDAILDRFYGILYDPARRRRRGDEDIIRQWQTYLNHPGFHSREPQEDLFGTNESAL